MYLSWLLFFENFDNVINYVHNFLAHPANATIILLIHLCHCREKWSRCCVALHSKEAGKRGTNWIEEERGAIDNQFLDCSHTAHCNKTHLAFWLSKDIGRRWKSKRFLKSREAFIKTVCFIGLWKELIGSYFNKNRNCTLRGNVLQGEMGGYVAKSLDSRRPSF